MCQFYQKNGENLSEGNFTVVIVAKYSCSKFNHELILRDISTAWNVWSRKFHRVKFNHGKFCDEILHFSIMCSARKYFRCFPKCWRQNCSWWNCHRGKFLRWNCWWRNCCSLKICAANLTAVKLSHTEIFGGETYTNPNFHYWQWFSWTIFVSFLKFPLNQSKYLSRYPFSITWALYLSGLQEN